jgi:hypothetical protein
MRLIGKLVIIIILLGILLSGSAYIILYTNENGGTDTEPPQITFISGNFTVAPGQIATVFVNFTDNVKVTEATLYYGIEESTYWNSLSILNGSASIDIPSDATTNYIYYVTVDDAAGNGPVGAPSTDGSQVYTITINSDNDEVVHTVFIEEATATWCTNCPNVANILYSLYEGQKYNFYYVALINDTNTIAAQRNTNDYHVYGFPTVFIDGGYKVIVGGNNPESTYTDAITMAQQRTMPKIKATVTIQYQNNTKQLTVNTLVQNKDNTLYNGKVKLYLTEIISHVTDYNSNNYHYGFLEYLTNENISIESGKSITLTDTKDISAYDYENLMIIAVVFNSEKHQGYANPSDTTANLFDAYYVDATNAVKIVEGGNLPPQLTITTPQKGKAYWNGKQMGIVDKLIERKHLIKKLENYSILKTLLYNKTYLLGGTKLVTVEASDDSAVARVEFSIDGVVQFNDTEAPYEFSFKKINKFKSLFLKDHVLTVTVYDDAGKSTSSSLLFNARI